MYRKGASGLEFFIVHPGGPFYKNKDEGVWDIPKGQIEAHESEQFEVAKREFFEETGIEPPQDAGLYLPLGEVQMKSGKIVYAWAFEGDFNGEITSNTITLEWPPHSGKKIEIPEVDRGGFCNYAEVSKKLNPALVQFCQRLQVKLQS